MKSYLILVTIFVFLSGCAVYKYELSSKGYGGGYVIRRYGLLIPEYTIDAQAHAPKDKELARRRFKRRKDVVNYYYKKMGRIYNDALTHIGDIGKLITGPFRLPGEAIENYKYEHNKDYREKIDIERQKEMKLERKQKLELKKQLQDYIKRDMEIEDSLKKP